MTPITITGGYLRIGLEPKGGGSSTKVFDYKGCAVWLGNFGKKNHAHIELESGWGLNLRVWIDATKEFSALYRLKQQFQESFRTKPMREYDAICAKVSAEVMEIALRLVRETAISLHTLHGLVSQAHELGVSEGRRNMAQSFKNLLEEAS